MDDKQEAEEKENRQEAKAKKVEGKIEFFSCMSFHLLGKLRCNIALYDIKFLQYINEYVGRKLTM